MGEVRLALRPHGNDKQGPIPTFDKALPAYRTASATRRW
jgi:hypothetical protein